MTTIKDGGNGMMKMYRNLKIRTKLMIGYAMLALITVIIG
jgi:hypothetical protein